MFRDIQHWMQSLTTLETWVVGGLLSVVLWCGIVLPLGYRLILVPMGLPSFWQRMRGEPNSAVVLVLFLLVLGPAVVYAGFVGLVFLVLVLVFRVLFFLLQALDR